MRSKNRKTRMNFFIMHLAIADLTVGLVSVATDIAWKTTVGFYAGNLVCKAVRYSQVLVTYSSTYVLVSLSIDRYDAITHPLNFTGSWKRAKILVASSWTLSAVFSIPAIFLNSETMMEGHPQCWIDLKQWQWKIYITLVATSLFFFPAVIISLCYSIIVHTIWAKSKTMTFPKVANKSKSKTKSSTDVNNKRTTGGDPDDFKRASSRGIIPKAKIKTVKMTFVIVFVFILCWSPYFVWDLLQVWGVIPVSQTTIAISTFIQSLAPLNSAANPFIYFLFSTHFCRNIRRFSLSRAFGRLCCCIKRPQNPQNLTIRCDYNTINSATHSSSRTQRFSMTSKSSPKSSKCSSVRKTLVIKDVKHRTQIEKQEFNDHKLIDTTNSVV
ncbi:cardioacceleratory peptide receptor-like [Oppia nitens]|uniref:cardioacceleratory peptide receptor-like n=1 Tax=Oppia nitens TaxID=1686743 RepID=UPI0023DC25F3|nr:cardioacceleratory peptide receptor-like [Oppia nitens]